MPSDMQSKPFGSCRKPSQPHEARLALKSSAPMSLMLAAWAESKGAYSNTLLSNEVNALRGGESKE